MRTKPEERAMPMNKLIIPLVIVLIVTIGIGGYFLFEKTSRIFSSTETFAGKPDPLTDNFTYTLPPGTSALRLSLPAKVEDIFYSEKTGIGGFGLHAGGHIEGLDHVWITLKPGTVVKSWADGTVIDVRLSGMAELGEYHITIDYGQNLIGVHMEIEKPLINVGDFVKRGQDIGYGMSFHPAQSSAEFSLVDLGRTDGVKYGKDSVYVSPFDYLEDSEKQKLVEAYKKYVIEPYLKEGKESEFFKPYQPYLTNKLFLHQGNKGKLTGEWYCLSSKWDQGFPNDLLTFIEAKNPYYSGNVVLAADDQNEGGKSDWSIEGTFEVDYEKGQIKITNYDGSVYFGIFEIDESGDRAKLKIEYQKDSYPTEFSSKAITYIERSNLPRREDAFNLGLIGSPYALSRNKLAISATLSFICLNVPAEPTLISGLCFLNQTSATGLRKALLKHTNRTFT